MELTDIPNPKATKSTVDSTGEQPASTEVVKQLSSYEGSTPAQRVDNAIANSRGKALVFAKSTCAFCTEARRTLETHGVPCEVIFFDKESQSGDARKALKAVSGIPTVPVVYVDAQLVGTCNSLKTMETNGELVKLLSGVSTVDAENPARVDATQKKYHRAPRTLFNFPDTVNTVAIRITSFMQMLICIFCVIFWERDNTRWVMAGLLVDCVLRFCAGPNLSALGMISAVICARIPPTLSPGPPKQFAVLCAITFSTLSTIFFFVDIEEVGAVWAALLAGASGLEAIFNFCLGCVFFAIGIQLGVFPRNVDKIHLNTLDERRAAWAENNLLSATNPTPRVMVVPVSNSGAPCAADIKYKVKHEDHWKEQFHMIKYMHISYFMVPVSIGTLAMVWQACDSVFIPVSDTMWNILGYVSAVIFCIFGLLYLAKIVLYRSKALKEWVDPKRCCMFAAIPICWMIYALLVKDEAKKFAEVLVWAGAGVSAFLQCYFMSVFITYRNEDSQMHFTWMTLPVANMFAGIALPMVNMDYKEAAFFFWGSGFVLSLAMFTLQLRRAVNWSNSDDRDRAGEWMLIVAPLCAALGYNTLQHNSPAMYDIFSKTMMYSGLTMFFIMCFATWPNRFFMRSQFSMSYWMFAFPINLLAYAWLAYHALIQSDFSHGLAHIAVVLATASTGVLGLHTLTALVAKHIFRPENKWGAFSAVNRLTHEAFRGAVVKMEQYLSALEKNPSSVLARNAFASTWSLVHLMHTEHSRHEDQFVFPALKQFAPLQPTHSEDEHARDREAFREVDELLATLNSSNAEQLPALISTLRSKFDVIAECLEQHLDWEEKHLQPIGRKYIPIQMQLNIITQLWNSTDVEVWRKLLPFMITMMPYHMMRVRFLRGLMWAMPERTQQLGIMLYANIDDVLWARLSFDIPEMIPRNVCGWKRFY